MFSPTFDWVFAGIMGVLAVIFFAGKGNGILRAFSGKDTMAQKKKRTPEQEMRYQRAIAWFLLAIGLREVLMAVLGFTYRWVPIVTMGIVILSMILLIIYLKKNFPE